MIVLNVGVLKGNYIIPSACAVQNYWLMNCGSAFDLLSAWAALPEDE
jgi:hypothetical protein